MNINDLLIKIKEKKYLIILLAVGIAIMLIPGKPSDEKNKNDILYESNNNVEEDKLEKILKKIKDVEFCEVYITYDNQGEIDYAYDLSTGNNKEIEIKLSDNEPLIKGRSNPEVRGIFVLIKGREINVNEIARMVKAATGTPLHRIYVKTS